MAEKPRFFIYERKEMVLLVVLGVIVSVFAFTLGVHLGKRVAPKPVQLATPDSVPVNPGEEKTPPREDLVEQAKSAPSVAEDLVRESLKEEVQTTGIKATKPIQTDLPENAKSKNAAATTLENTGKPKALAKPMKVEARPGADAPVPVSHQEQDIAAPVAAPATHAATPAKPAAAHQEESPAAVEESFILQAGSYPTQSEAIRKKEVLDKHHPRVLVKTVDIQGKGTWYRVLLVDFKSKEAAERLGAKLKEEKLLESYIVLKSE